MDLPLSALIPMDIEQAIAAGRLERARIASTIPVPESMLSASSGEPASQIEEGPRRIMLWIVLLAGAALLIGMALSLLRGKKDDPGKDR